MRRRIDPSPQLLSLAAKQGGVLSSEQTSGFGLPERSVDRLLAAGAWQRLGRGIFVVHDQDPSWLGWAWGGILLGGPESRLGGLAAAHLYRLEDPPREIEVLIPWARRLTTRERWRFVRERPGTRSPRSPGDPPRTTFEDTVIDLTERGTEGEVVDLVTRAVQSRRTTPLRLARCAESRSRLRHRTLLLKLLGDVAEGAESPLELRFLHDVERPHQLPRGHRQQVPGYGNYRQDVRYRAYGLVVELDGRLGHDGVGAFRDMFRDNAGVVAGTATLRYGWRDTIERSCPMAFQIASVLVQRGWRDRPTRCRRCRGVAETDLC